MYRLRKKNVANTPSETLNATVLPAENAGILKNDKGVIACGFRDSYTRNAIRQTADRTSEPTISGSLHPFSFASITPYVTRNSDDVPRITPPKSSERCSSETDSRTVRVAMTNATMPI